MLLLLDGTDDNNNDLWFERRSNQGDGGGRRKRRGVAVVEWDASPANDVIADAVVALVMHAQTSAASIRLFSKPCRHGTNNNRRTRRTDENDD